MQDNSVISKVDAALADIRNGKMVIVVDDEDRENEGDLVMAAEHITAEAINFMTRFARGLICLSMTKADFERLDIPMMVERNQTPRQTAFGVSIEAAVGISTGISAHDRALTIKTAVDPQSGPSDIIKPGHVFPLKARDNGVLDRQGHTEGSVDLAKLAGLKGAAVICEIMNDDGTMARLHDLQKFSQQYDLKIISVQDIIHYRLQKENSVEEVSSSRLPIKQHGDFEIKTFRNVVDNMECVVLIADKFSKQSPSLLRLHSECLTGDVFGSLRCDCGSQLENALDMMAKEGGVLLYLRQEGRGIGLANKIKAYALQDQGMDTVEANHALGFGADERDYTFAAAVIKQLGIHSIRLLTNNPDKVTAMESCDVNVVERVPLETVPTKHNIDYLKTKQKKMGHRLSLADV